MKKNKNITHKLIMILFTFILVLTSFNSNVYGAEDAAANSDYAKPAQVLSDLVNMYDGYVNEDQLKLKFIESISTNTANMNDEEKEKFIDGVIKDVVSSIGDPYTSYMDKEDYLSFNTISTGKYVGTGISAFANKNTNKIEVLKVYEGSPADELGVKAGDYITKINNINVNAKKADKANELLKGEEGSSVAITTYRNGTGYINLTLKRVPIIISTVYGEMINDKVGYISVSAFDGNTSLNFEKKLNELKSQNMKGLILDLRNNGGGLVNQSINMASNFIKKDDLILSTKGKHFSEKKFYSQGGDFIGLPMVILINENSASASEIFIGAMVDYKLATTVGTVSFGKGIEQVVKKYPDDTAIKITIAKFYLPLGKNIQGRGISPDFKVDYPENLYKEPYSINKDPQFQKALSVINSKL